MEVILFIDDEKLPEWFDLPKDTTHAQSSNEAIELWGKRDFDILYLDYDIDETKGDELLKKMVVVKKPKLVKIISINQSGGVPHIIKVCEQNEIPFEDIGMKVMFDKFTILDGQSG